MSTDSALNVQPPIEDIYVDISEDEGVRCEIFNDNPFFPTEDINFERSHDRAKTPSCNVDVMNESSRSLPECDKDSNQRQIECEKEANAPEREDQGQPVADRSEQSNEEVHK